MLRKLARDVSAHGLKKDDEVEIVSVGKLGQWIAVKKDGRMGLVKAEDLTNEQKTMEGLDA